MLTINNFIWLQIKNKSFIYQLLAKHRTEAQATAEKERTRTANRGSGFKIR